MSFDTVLGATFLTFGDTRVFETTKPSGKTDLRRVMYPASARIQKGVCVCVFVEAGAVWYDYQFGLDSFAEIEG